MFLFLFVVVFYVVPAIFLWGRIDRWAKREGIKYIRPTIAFVPLINIIVIVIWFWFEDYQNK